MAYDATDLMHIDGTPFNIPQESKMNRGDRRRFKSKLERLFRNGKRKRSVRAPQADNLSGEA
jgi:hypothetical protein